MTRYRVYSTDYLYRKIKPSKDWTTDKKEMGYDCYWANRDCDGQRIVRNHGLKWARPIMRSTPQSGDFLHMFQSGSKYYLWNPVEGGIFEIVTSMDLEGIVAEIDKPRLGSLELVEIDQVYSG